MPPLIPYFTMRSTYNNDRIIWTNRIMILIFRKMQVAKYPIDLILLLVAPVFGGLVLWRLSDLLIPILSAGWIHLLWYSEDPVTFKEKCIWTAAKLIWSTRTFAWNFSEKTHTLWKNPTSLSLRVVTDTHTQTHTQTMSMLLHLTRHRRGV